MATKRATKRTPAKPKKGTTKVKKATTKATSVKKAAGKAMVKKAAKSTAKKTTAKKATTRKTAVKKAPARKTSGAKTAARKVAVKKATERTLVRKAPVKKAATPAGVGKPGTSVVKKATATPAKKSTTTKTVPIKVAEVAARKTAKPVAKRALDAPTVAVKSTPGSGSEKKAPRKQGTITPEQALENTRKLLEAKHEHDRQLQPWQQLDEGHGHAAPSGHGGHESEEAAAKAEQLHAAESRTQAIQGSISTQDRHNQGKRDNR